MNGSQNVTVPCEPRFNFSTAMHISLIPAVIIIAILSILHRRRVKCVSCNWRPGMVVPSNFLDGYRNRWAYAAAFGATSNRLLLLLINRDLYWESQLEAPMWVRQTFLLVLAIMETSTVFFPLFACLTTRYKFVGGIFGVSYSLAWCILQIIYMLDCPENIDTTSFIILPVPYSKLIYQWPSALFLGIMVGEFLRVILTCYRTKQYIEKEVEPLALPHQMTYVRCLFKGLLPEKIVSAEAETIFKTFSYKSVEGFLYPSRLLCVLFVTMSLSYQMVIGIYYICSVLTDQLKQLVQTLPQLNLTVEADKFIEGSGTVQVACSWVVAFLLICLLVGSLFLIFKNYRRHILQMSRGDKSFVPFMNATSAKLMASSMRWTGYQIAYLLWGLLIFYVTVFLFLFAAVEVVYAVIYFSAWHGVESLFLYIGIEIKDVLGICVLLNKGPPLLMNIIIYYSQVIWAQLFFLQPKPEGEESQPLAIDNRKAFETANFFTFFINIAIGLFSTIFRLFLSMVTGLITLGRMDQSILKKGYERIDRGHQAYIGMLFVDHAHNHPVLRVFCAALTAVIGQSGEGTPEELTSVPDDPDLSGYGSFVSSSAQASFKSQRSRCDKATKRWQLAYTLLKNPDLIQYRKHNLDRKRPSVAPNGVSWHNGNPPKTAEV